MPQLQARTNEGAVAFSGRGDDALELTALSHVRRYGSQSEKGKGGFITGAAFGSNPCVGRCAAYGNCAAQPDIGYLTRREGILGSGSVKVGANANQD